jgi:adenylate cyclase
MVSELHTFLFADLVDFTRFTARHGDQHAAELAVRFHERVGTLAASLGCQLVKTIGDGVMVRASNGDAAVELARRVLRLHAEDADLRARVGLDTGPAVGHRGDWFGSTVNTAARVTAAADAGELLMTERTQLAAEGLLGGPLPERGRHRLKGLPDHTLFGEALA